MASKNRNRQRSAKITAADLKALGWQKYPGLWIRVYGRSTWKYVEEKRNLCAKLTCLNDKAPDWAVASQALNEHDPRLLHDAWLLETQFDQMSPIVDEHGWTHLKYTGEHILGYRYVCCENYCPSVAYDKTEDSSVDPDMDDDDEDDELGEIDDEDRRKDGLKLYYVFEPTGRQIEGDDGADIVFEAIFDICNEYAISLCRECNTKISELVVEEDDLGVYVRFNAREIARPGYFKDYSAVYHTIQHFDKDVPVRAIRIAYSPLLYLQTVDGQREAFWYIRSPDEWLKNPPQTGDAPPAELN